MNSELKLSCGFLYGRTMIKDIYSTPPYKIMHPFMNQEKMEVILMSSSAGLLKGDMVTNSIFLEAQANLTFLTQSYEKILDTMDGYAGRKLNIVLEENSCLAYLPQPVIPFKNSDFRAMTTIHVKKNAKLFYSDICSCGRVGMGERFELKNYQSRTNIFVENELVFSDYTLIRPEEMDYTQIGMWGEYTHCGMLFLYMENMEEELEICRKIQQEADHRGLLSGATRCPKGVLIRSLGESGDQIYRFHFEIVKQFNK